MGAKETMVKDSCKMYDEETGKIALIHAANALRNSAEEEGEYASSLD